MFDKLLITAYALLGVSVLVMVASSLLFAWRAFFNRQTVAHSTRVYPQRVYWNDRTNERRRRRQQQARVEEFPLEDPVPAYQPPMALPPYRPSVTLPLSVWFGDPYTPHTYQEPIGSGQDMRHAAYAVTEPPPIYQPRTPPRPPLFYESRWSTQSPVIFSHESSTSSTLADEEVAEGGMDERDVAGEEDIAQGEDAETQAMES